MTVLVKTPELHYSMIQFLNIPVVWEHQYGYHENALNDFCFLHLDSVTYSLSQAI